MKFTDEQLSRVLTAHACGGLTVASGGYGYAGYPGCLFQVALEVDTIGECPDVTGMDWFDEHYQRDWSVEMFLTQLEIRGLA